jgi:hypothetical protein
VPPGNVPVLQKKPPSLVLTTIAAEKLALKPTPVQSRVLAQEMPWRVASELSTHLTQVRPPSVVLMTTAPSTLPAEPAPAAQQSDVLGQVTTLRVPTPLGSSSATQVTPPSVVATSTDPVNNELYPTAQQSDVLGQATS